MNDRRAFISNLVTAIVMVPRRIHGEPARTVYKIGILSTNATSELVGPEPRAAPAINALLRGLRELGYVYGQHFVTEPRGAAGRPERFPGLAAELVRIQVDVIVAAGPALAALKQATSTIPIVMGGSSDPVGEGLVQSLARPGTNFTGLSRQGRETAGKRLELLKELVPGAAPTAVLWERANFASWQATETAAHERGWKLLSLEVRDAGELERAFEVANRAGASALLVFAGAVLFPQRRRIVELAARSRLPAIYEFSRFVEAGGLISYAADLDEIWRRAAVFVDKILKGAKPADLPVEQPTKFELVVNLSAAKSIKFTIPTLVLSRADRVIP